MMPLYTVAYTHPDYPFTLYFHCYAEDATHARLQCETTYRDATVLKVCEGPTITGVNHERT